MGTDEVATDRLANFRDVGGKPAAGGQVIRSGVYYRSDMPRVGDEPPAGAATWPPPTVIDLRSAVERGSSPHPLSLLGSDVRVLPLLGEETGRVSSSLPAEALAGGLRTLYVAILDIAAPRLVEIVDLVAEAPGPVLVHCAAGKDRTGIVTALLLRLAGVGPEEIIADYLATGANMGGVLQRLKGHMLLPGAKTAPRAVSEVSREAVEQVLSVFGGNPAGAEGWLLDHGANPDSIAHWRKRIVD